MCTIALFVAAGTASVSAQVTDPSVGVGAHIGVLRLSELDVTDTGVGVHAAWRAAPIFAVEGALTWFPEGDASGASERIAKQQRVLGLIGVRSGIRRGAVELFGRTRVGFLRFSPVDEVACIAITIFPPPLECQLAAGHTSFATEVGGGISVAAGNRLRLHVDAADLLVRYGLTAFRPNRTSTDGFTSHNLRIGAGLTWGF